MRAALLNARFEFPARRITVNLAPADLPKEGSHYDLPIALGLMAAIGAIPPDGEDPQVEDPLNIDPLAPLEGDRRRFSGELG